ncbi:glutamine--tRNA ligase/YqeY domain fusion protein [bacterium]|nr:glutamine--tRNA ligase/YqeY domain fusion protein [candidate division CSSED10-310 bacterium]
MNKNTDNTRESLAKPSGNGESPSNFIKNIIIDDFRTNKYGGRIHTRFPPEPNGYLHIGHAKAICLDFGMAEEFGGKCNLRFDDTNPMKEDVEYIESIKEDIHWLGFDWEDREYYASDYFEQLYDYAIQLIKDGKAYVCDLTPDQMREYRGTLTQPGIDSPFRSRTVEENLDLFERMRAGEFEEGSRVLRAKIDMRAGNINMRDPVIYRIIKASHHRTGDKWCIYPMYDYTHCLSDSIERITHSLCSLEFEDHRPLYDWFLDQLGVFHPQQIEFARLNLTYTLMSKRKLRLLVEEGYVDGWDDPRLLTLSGLRRRGYTPEAIREFCDRIGVAKANSVVDISLLEHCLREDLNKRASRAMAVLNPLKVVIDNYPADKEEHVEAVNNPEDESMGTRMLPFSNIIYIERDDFREDPPRKYFRLAPGREVRLKHAYYITCDKFLKDESTGEIIELHCHYDPESRGGWTKDARKIQGTLHWVSAKHAVDAEIRLFDHLFTKPDPNDLEEGQTFKDLINTQSSTALKKCKIEPGLVDMIQPVQFLRHGYFIADAKLSKPEKPVFNRSVPLRDTWAKIEKSLDK